MSTGAVLEMRGIRKGFPGVQALAAVDFDLRAGEIHALVGENGAGKSTLMKILSGVYRNDAGEIRLDGRPVEIQGPRHAQTLRIRTIHQEFNLVPNLSVAENIALAELAAGLLRPLGHAGLARRAAEVLETLGVRIDPRTPVERLRVAERQIVEIARALSGEARILVMDEPTAALTEVEVERLFRIIRGLRARGVAVVYISHKLAEVFRIADRITVLRDGRRVGVCQVSETDREEIVRLMVGRTLDRFFPKEPVPPGEPVLEVEGLSVPGRLHDVSFTVRRGEVVGVAGLMGAGQLELARALFGLLTLAGGRVRVAARPVRLRSPAAAIAAGIGLVTENRREEGLILRQPVQTNITLAALRRLVRLELIQRAQERELATGFVRRLGIRVRDLGQAVEELSGGNQQKVVLSKGLATDPEVIILCEPTRGVDVGAKVEIYRVMNGLAREGKGLLLVSSELPELVGMSDRILVMGKGRIVAEFAAAEASQEQILHYATGGRASA